MRQKIVIAGGGISALVLAHQLSKLPDRYEIHIYELNDQIGGLARSSRDKNGCATEYSWRIYFWFYKNLFSILKEIPIGENKMVLDNLSIKGNSEFMYPNDRRRSIQDTLEFILKLTSFGTTCDRDAQLLDEITWQQYMKHSNSEHEDVWETTPQVLGLDKYLASAYSVLKIGMQALILHPWNSHNYAMTKPTSEAWFQPWQAFLIQQGVHFHLQMRMTDIFQSHRDPRRIRGMKFVSLTKNSVEIIEADHFVLNLPVQELARIVLSHPWLQSERQLRSIPLLAEKSYILQLCFQVHFPIPIYLADPRSSVTGFIVVDSPWSVIIETREALFKNTCLCSKLPEVRGSWSILAGQDRVPGIVFQKPLSRCSEVEIQIELWAQITRNRDVRNAAKKWNFGLDLERVLKLWSPIWPTFYHDKFGQLRTTEPKFSNNVGTLKLRPTCHLQQFDNLHLASAYTREAVDIFSMEGACISGMTVAKNISNYSNLGPVYSYNGPKIFQPLKSIDCIF